jgi:hypothetical protein
MLDLIFTFAIAVSSGRRYCDAVRTNRLFIVARRFLPPLTRYHKSLLASSSSRLAKKAPRSPHLLAVCLRSRFAPSRMG